MSPIAPGAGRRRAARSRRDWRLSRLRRHAAFLLVGLPLQAAGLFTSGLALLLIGTRVNLPAGRALHAAGAGAGSVGLLVGSRSFAWLVGLVIALILLPPATERLTGWQRMRFRRWLGVTIPEPPAPGNTSPGANSPRRPSRGTD